MVTEPASMSALIFAFCPTVSDPPDLIVPSTCPSMINSLLKVTSPLMDTSLERIPLPPVRPAPESLVPLAKEAGRAGDGDGEGAGAGVDVGLKFVPSIRHNRGRSAICQRKLHRSTKLFRLCAIHSAAGPAVREQVFTDIPMR